MASNLSIVHRIFGSGFSISRWYIPGHDGIDLPAKEGTPIFAVTGGIVEYARDARTDPNCGRGWACGGGNVVDINIGNNFATQYAHLSRFLVKPGEHVDTGQLIGYVGRTGGTDASGNFGGAGAKFVGSHLHFGLWDKSRNKMIDPTSFLGDTSANPTRPGGGASTPLTPSPSNPQSGYSLGAFNNLVSFPVGHRITNDDIGTISSKLQAAGWFSTDIQRVAFENFMFDNALGKTWNKDLQDKLAGQAITDANNIGNVLPNIDVGAALMFVAIVLVGITFLILGGIVTLRKNK